MTNNYGVTEKHDSRQNSQIAREEAEWAGSTLYDRYKYKPLEPHKEDDEG